MATTAELQVVIRAQDQASKVITGLEKTVAGLSGAFTAPVKAVGALTSALGTVGLAAAGVEAVAGAAKGLGGVLGVGLASNVETVRAQFLAFTKSGAETDKILQQLRAEAAATPFTFQQMATAAASLLPASKQANVGLEALIKQAELLAAVNPGEGLEGAAFALREALSGDFVSIVERFNLPRQRLNELKAEGVPAMEAVSIALREMGVDAELVANLANTTTGRLSTFQDAIDEVRLVAGQPILEALGRSLDRFSALLQANQEPLRRFAQNLGDLLARGVEIGTDALLGLIRVLDRVGPVFDAVGRAALAAVHGDFESAMAGLREGAEGAAGILQDVFGGAVADLQSTFAAFAPTASRLGDLFGAVGEAASDAAGQGLALLQRGVEEVLDVLGGGEGILEAAAGGINNLSAAAEATVPVLAAMAGVLGAVGEAAVPLTAQFADFLVQQNLVSQKTAELTGTSQRLSAVMDALWAVLAKTPVGQVITALQALVAQIQSAQGAARELASGTDRAWQAMIAAAGAVRDQVIARLNELSAFIRSLPGRFQADAVGIGVAIVNGIVQGLNPSRVIQAAVGLAQSAISAAKAALGVSSPSREFEEIAEDTVEGFVVGVEGSASDAEAAIGDAMTAVAEAAADPFAGLAEVLGAQFERTLSVVERAQLDIENARDEIIRKADRDRELEERRHQRRLVDLQEELGGASVKAREGVLEQIRQAHEAHARKVEDIETGMNDRLEELAFDSADRIAAATERQALARGEALRDLQRGVDDLFRATEEKMGDIRRKADEARTAARDDAAEQLEAVGERALVQIQELLGRRDLDRGIRARRDAFDERQDEAARAFKAERDAEERRYKLGRDLEKAKTDDERRAIRQRFDEAERDAERRKRLDEEERAFRQRQEAERVRFTDTLEDEAIARQIKRIEAERDERVRSITEALEEKLRRVTESEERERAELARSAEQKLADLKERFYDKVGPLTAEAKDGFEALFRSLTAHIGTATQAVVGLADALARVSGARSGGAAPGGSGAADSATWANQSQAVRDMFEAANPGRGQQAWEAERARDLAAAASMIDLPQPTGYDPTSGLPTGPGYFEPVPNTDYWQENWDRFNPLPYGTEYPPQAFYGSDSESRDVFGGNNDYSENAYATGGMVPGPAGSAQRAIVHGGEGVFTPDQLAALARYGWGGGGGGAVGTVEVPVYLDGAEITRVVWDRLKRQGLVGGDLGL